MGEMHGLRGMRWPMHEQGHVARAGRKKGVAIRRTGSGMILLHTPKIPRSGYGVQVRVKVDYSCDYGCGIIRETFFRKANSTVT